MEIAWWAHSTLSYYGYFFAGDTSGFEPENPFAHGLPVLQTINQVHCSRDVEETSNAGFGQAHADSCTESLIGCYRGPLTKQTRKTHQFSRSGHDTPVQSRLSRHARHSVVAPSLAAPLLTVIGQQWGQVYVRTLWQCSTTFGRG